MEVLKTILAIVLFGALLSHAAPIAGGDADTVEASPKQDVHCTDEQENEGVADESKDTETSNPEEEPSEIEETEPEEEDQETTSSQKREIAADEEEEEGTQETYPEEEDSEGTDETSESDATEPGSEDETEVKKQKVKRDTESDQEEKYAMDSHVIKYASPYIGDAFGEHPAKSDDDDGEDTDEEDEDRVEREAHHGEDLETAEASDNADEHKRVKRRLQMGFLHKSKPSSRAITGTKPKIDRLFEPSASQIRRSHKRKSG